MKAPAFWQEDSIAATLLKPVSCLYAAAAAFRERMVKTRSFSVPVICIGNLTLGGTGKTPLVMLLAEKFRERSLRAHVISRGYGGSLKGPVRVNPSVHRYDQVGDEPLLIASVAPCWVAKERAEGIEAAIAAGAQFILLDDGLQNPTIKKDFSFIVIDGPAGFGNGHVFPAGPLREPVSEGLKRGQAFILIDEDRHQLASQLAAQAPVFKGFFESEGKVIESLKGNNVIAFAGTGRPSKFFNGLKQMGLQLTACHAFADHHPYTDREIKSLLKQADVEKAKLVTTPKDMVRIPPAYQQSITAVPITLALDKLDEILTLIGKEIHL